ncbi:hypothetical protein BYT27DRAFT_7199235 [Phlegmacium glaucopus]|nr:hypothetical protein BYT27DRAFT_7199235 [Phlegmacium glaucopus]
MESDIYCTPRALFQMIDQMENVIDRSKKFLSTSPEPQGPKIVYDDLLSERKVPLPPHGPSIPAVIVQNKALLRIVNKCLKPWPHRRPTAQILCDMLLDFCKSEIIKSVLHKAGKWVLSKLKCLAP